MFHRSAPVNAFSASSLLFCCQPRRVQLPFLPQPFTEVQPGKEKTEPWKKINIAGLTRPDLFLDALLTVTARFEFGDPYKYKLQYTVSLVVCLFVCLRFRKAPLWLLPLPLRVRQLSAVATRGFKIYWTLDGVNSVKQNTEVLPFKLVSGRVQKIS